MRLFGAIDIGILFDNIKKKVEEQITHELKLEMNEDDYINYLTMEYELEEFIINKDKIQREEIEIHKEGVSGIKITILFPYQGQNDYFSYHPSSYSLLHNLNFYRKEPGNILCFDLDFALDNARINYYINMAINDILGNFQSFNNDIQSFNNSLRPYIKCLVEKKKQILSKFKKVSEGINIPLKKREDPPPYIPLKRKKIRLKLPEVEKSPISPYSTIALDDYEDVLEVCLHMGIAMERSPVTFEDLREEDIRNFFLVILNAYFEGKATGETFNRSGKTDILIRHEDNNVLIVECKNWEGKSMIKKSLDQLFSYITWRDTKTAIFFFYKRKSKSLTRVLEEIKSELENHSNYKDIYNFSNKRLKEEKILGCLFSHPSDIERLIYLTIMVFDVH